MQNDHQKLRVKGKISTYRTIVLSKAKSELFLMVAQIVVELMRKVSSCLALI